MSKALIKPLGIPTPDQFKTDYSQSMKVMIEMNTLVSAYEIYIDKSDAKMVLMPAIPKVFADRAEGTDKIYLCMIIKDDENTTHAFFVDYKVDAFVSPVTMNGVDFLTPDEVWREIITAAKYTAAKHYDVTVIFSNMEITPEVQENPYDNPFVLYGKAISTVYDVTCSA